MSGARYSRLSSTAGNGDASESSSSIVTDNTIGDIELEPINPSGVFSVRVLHKEKAYEVSELTSDTSIGSFKNSIATVVTIPAEQQRLIFSGKPLKPDTKTLAEFKIEAGSSVHLFPIPVAVLAPTPSDSENVVNVQMNPILLAFQRRAANNVVLPIHFDPGVAQNAREVKMWSFILVFLSAMTVINNLSFLMSNNVSEATTFDLVVVLFETLCSFGGLYVGGLGFESARNYNLPTVQIYVKYLSLLAIASVSMRILWLIDVVIDVKAMLWHQQHDVSNDAPPTNEPVMDSKSVHTFEIQASLICLICMFAWLNCVVRGIHLRNSVAVYNEAMNV